MGYDEEIPKEELGGASMNDEKVIMRAQDPNVRNKNFEEVELGYTKEEALKEWKNAYVSNIFLII